MIDYNNNIITKISFNNHDIKRVYGCDGNLVWSGDTEPHDYTKDCLGFVAKEDIFFTFHYADVPTPLYFSTNGGLTWRHLNNETTDRTPIIHAGEKIIWKGQLIPQSSTYGIGRFISYNSLNKDYKGRFSIEGNVMSLLFGDNFSGQTSLNGYDNAFVKLFYGLTELENVDNLILPATTLSYNCYSSMFHGCTSLTTAPMLPAATLTQMCYSDMFNGCSNLRKVTCFAEDISADYCTMNWVKGVAANGTFIKSANMQSWAIGNDGIPNGWIIQ